MPQNVVALDLGRAPGCPESESSRAVLTTRRIDLLTEVRNDLSSGRGSAKGSSGRRP